MKQWDRERTLVQAAKAEGKAEGAAFRDTQKITDMLNRGKTPNEIADFCGYPLEQILAVQEELEHK